MKYRRKSRLEEEEEEEAEEDGQVLGRLWKERLPSRFGSVNLSSPVMAMTILKRL